MKLHSAVGCGQCVSRGRFLGLIFRLIHQKIGYIWQLRLTLLCFLAHSGYEGAPSFPVDFAKYVHDLLDKSHSKEKSSTTPILIS